MKKFALASIIVLSTAATAVFGQTAAPGTKSGKDETRSSASPAKIEREKFDPLRDPKEDLQNAVARAREENKRIILDIGGEWCGWCILMDKFLVKNAGLKKLRDDNFVWVKVNFSPENENREFLAAYPEIKGFPHLYVLEKDGTLLHSQNTEELEEGDTYDLQKFTDFLKTWSPAKLSK